MSRVMPLVVVVFVLFSGRAFAQDRGGFTALVDFGVGVQSDAAIEETAVGFAGVNFGAGAFLNKDLALMFRLASTTVNYDFGEEGDFTQTSGVAGPAVQWWLSDRFNIEAGAGWGFWNGGGEKSNGFGVLVGLGVPIFNRGKHSLQVGVQYAHAFTDPGTVHNLGITLGYQFQ